MQKKLKRTFITAATAIAVAGSLDLTEKEGLIRTSLNNSALYKEPISFSASKVVNIHDIDFINDFCPQLETVQTIKVPFNSEAYPLSNYFLSLYGSFPSPSHMAAQERKKHEDEMAYISTLNANDALYISINSTGGAITYLKDLQEAYDRSGVYKIMFAEYTASSAASAFLATGEERLVHEDTKMILHTIRRLEKAHTGTYDIKQITIERFGSDYGYFHAVNRNLRRSNADFRDLYVDHSTTQISYGCVNKLIQDYQDTNVSPIDALKLGLVDGVYNDDKTEVIIRQNEALIGTKIAATPLAPSSPLPQ